MSRYEAYNRIAFVELYRDYSPPFPLVSELQRSLRIVPFKYLKGLDRIVLTNRAALPRSRRRAKTYSRKRTVRIPDAWGLYHHATTSEPAFIELIVDHALKSNASLGQLQRMVTCLMLSSTLFHEIGHHIHETKSHEQGNPERIANKYQGRFTKRLMLRKSPLFLILCIGLALQLKFWLRLPRWIAELRSIRKSAHCRNQRERKTSK